MKKLALVAAMLFGVALFAPAFAQEPVKPKKECTKECSKECKKECGKTTTGEKAKPCCPSTEKK